MKKLLKCIVAMTLAISVSNITALVNKGGRWRNFVDNDGDGICDNYTTCTSQNGSGFK